MTGSSSCAKCGNGIFKLVTQEPVGTDFKFSFVQCSSCNTPVGVLDYFNIGQLLQNQNKLIRNIQSRLTNIEDSIAVVARRLQR
jgi:hypothetical protein